LQVFVEVGSIHKLCLGVLLEKKLLVVFYLNSVFFFIMFLRKYTLPRGYITIGVGNFKRYVLLQNDLKQFWSSVEMVAHVMIWTYMCRKSAEFIVNKILFGCPPPCLILGQDNCSILKSSQIKEVLLLGNHEAFLKYFPCILFQGQHSQLWEDFKSNATNTLLIGDTLQQWECGERSTMQQWECGGATFMV
jgi:hypothetical protein